MFGAVPDLTLTSSDGGVRYSTALHAEFGLASVRIDNQTRLRTELEKPKRAGSFKPAAVEFPKYLLMMRAINVAVLMHK